MIVRAESDAQLLAARDVLRQLRPHLPADDAGYLAALRPPMREGYRLVACLDDGGVVRAVAGYRVMRQLYCDRLLSLDDLVTDATVRSRGYGARLLAWLREEGRAAGCTELHLLSNVVREDAHRFYFREGFGIQGYFFRARL